MTIVCSRFVRTTTTDYIADWAGLRGKQSKAEKGNNNDTEEERRKNWKTKWKK